MKKRIILSSIITMLLCFCMIGGATYALFTSETSVNIAVTSGKVKVEAGIENLTLYSMGKEQTDVFENGGTAVYDETTGILTLTNVTPGDKVEFNIVVENLSNIDIQYRANWKVEGKLSEVLEATADGVKFADVQWTEWKADAAEKQQTIKVVVELPVQVGNEYQEQVANVAFMVEAIQANGFLQNYVTPATIDAALANAQEGETIELAAGYYDEIVVPQNGMTIFSQEGAEVGFLNVNGKDNVTIQGLTFDAANAKYVYNGNGKAVQPANIAGASKGNTKGTSNLVIDGCTFTGEFADGGVVIAFTDQGRGSGQSGNITIKNCTFEATNGYADIYTYYSGKGSFVIENNTFASTMNAEVSGTYPIYLGKYQSSTPVVVKGNTFVNRATFGKAAYIQDHSNYKVSFAAADNTFAE